MATIGSKDSTTELLSAQGKEKEKAEKAEKAEKNEEAEAEEEEEAQTTMEESGASNQSQINDKNSDYNLNHNPNDNDNDNDIINININLDISNNLVSSSSSTSSSPPPMPVISVPFPGLNINNDIISNSDNDNDNINDNLNDSINDNNIGINPAIDDHMVIMMPSSPSQAALDESSSTSSANINEDLPFFQNNSIITRNNNNNNNSDNNNNNNNDSINININIDNNNISIEGPVPPAAACWPWQEAAVTPTNPILPRQHHHPAHYPADESASVDCDVSSLYLSTCSLDHPGSTVAADRIQFEFLASGDPHNHNHDVNLNHNNEHEHDHSHSHNHDHGYHHHPRLFNSFSDISSCVTHGDACNEAASYDSVSVCSNNNNNSSSSHTHHSSNNNHNGGNVYFQAANAYGGTAYMPYGMHGMAHLHPHASYLSPHVMMEHSLAAAGGHMGYSGPFAHGDMWGTMAAAAQESLGSYSSSLIDLNNLTMGLPHPTHVSSLYADSPPKLSLKRHCEDVDGVLPSKRTFMGSNNMNMNTSHHAMPFNNTKVGTSPQQQGATSNVSIKQRARQGTANDPQSIAARLRRERISERLKILQELVPNGSKVDLVTMLEKAISYVKFLQLQVKVLTTDEYWPSSTSLNKAMKSTSSTSVKAEDDLPNGGVSDAKPKKEATRA